MKIYKLYNPGLNYKKISYGETPVLDNIGKIKWENIHSIASFHFHWDKEDNEKPICDCPFIIGAIPVFSVPAYKVIEPFIESHQAQIIPVTIDGLSYYIVNTTLVLNDILSERCSKIERFSNGDIMDIDQYVFKKYQKEIPPFFRIEQLPTFTFVNEEVGNIIKNSRMTGVGLEDCKVKKWIL